METGKIKINKTDILLFSIPLTVLITFISYTGLFTEGFYSAETPNWQAQSIGQDMVDLFFAVPFFIVATILTCKNYRFSIFLWAGILLYFIYTFTIYCFDVHFNKFFMLYCLILGLSFYSFLYFLHSLLKRNYQLTLKKKMPAKITGIYFIAISIFFYFLWLSDIIPSLLQNKLPKILSESGLPTNPVHVIDMAIFLPGLMFTGILILKQRMLGLLLAPVFLTFFILMDITIGGLVLYMENKGIDINFSVSIMMSLMAIFSVALLVSYLNNLKLKLY